MGRREEEEEERGLTVLSGGWFMPFGKWGLLIGRQQLLLSSDF